MSASSLLTSDIGFDLSESTTETCAVELRGVVADLANEAAGLGVDLVDIAGVIQDAAALATRHADISAPAITDIAVHRRAKIVTSRVKSRIRLEAF